MIATHRRLKIGFSIGIVILLLNALVPILNRYWLLAGHTRLERIEEAYNAATLLLSAFKDAETGVRGYLLSGHEGFLLPYVQGLQSASEQMAVLQSRLNGDAESRRRMKTIQSLTGALRPIYERMIATRRLDGLQAVDQTTIGKSKLLMDQLRADSDDLTSTIRLHKGEIEAFIQTRNEWANTIVVAVMLLDVVVFSVLYWVTQRFLKDRHLAENNLRLVGRTLEETNKQQERHNKEISLLSRMASALQSTTCADEFFDIVGKFARQIFPRHPGAIYLYHPSRDLIERKTNWNEPTHDAALFEPDHCWAIRRGQPHRVVSPENDLVCRHAHGIEGSYFCLPLIAHGEPLGMLYLEAAHGEGGNGIDTQTMQVATALSEQVALAISNMNLRETLRHQSIIDPLTGLYNRRFLDETLRRELMRAKRNETRITVVMLDIDHFKRYNDSYGHEAGDQVLRALAQELQRQVRGSDLACRFGGEEFTLIFSDADIENTARRADAIRESIASLTIRHAGHALEAVTISMGVAGYPEHGDSPEALLQAADLALYQAKRDGRNRVTTYHPTLKLNSVKGRMCDTH